MRTKTSPERVSMRDASARRFGTTPDLWGWRSVGEVAMPRYAMTSSFGAVERWIS